MRGTTQPTTSHIIIEAAEDQSSATVSITSGSFMRNGMMPDRTLFRDITFITNGTDKTSLRGSNSNGMSVVFEDCVFDGARTENSGEYLLAAPRIWFINCIEQNPRLNAAQVFGSLKKNCNLLGCSGVGFSGVYSMLGCVGGGITLSEASVARFSGDGAVISFSFLSGAGTIITGKDDWQFDSDLGVSLSGLVVERKDTGLGPAVKLWADSNAYGATNVNMHATTIWGEAVSGRVNFMYLDGSTFAPGLDTSMRFVVVPWWPRKSDVFAGDNSVGNDGEEYGNWPVIFHVGHQSNCMTQGELATNAEQGPGSWCRETDHPGMQYGDGAGGALDPLWTSDRSGAGSAAGGGDYRPAAGSPLGGIPAGLAPFPIDHLGQAVPDDGTGVIGALQRAA
jgi:hypothetical protein